MEEPKVHMGRLDEVMERNRVRHKKYIEVTSIS